MVREVRKNIMKIMLKVGFYIVLSGGIIISSLSARDIQETVLRAHKSFEDGNIENALELYESIEKKGTATLYNMGLCHYKMGSFMQALVCLKRAERNATSAELSDIYYTIDQVHDALKLESGNSFLRSVYRWHVVFLSILTLYGWQLLFLFLWAILLFLSARFVRRRRYFGLTMLSLVVILSAGAVYRKYDLCNNSYGIALKDNIVVYAGPDDAFHELGSLSRANEIVVSENQDEWFKVKHGNCSGWVYSDNIALI